MPRIKSVLLAFTLGAILVACLSSNEVMASLRFCNKTDSPVSLSTAWAIKSFPVVRARGWWRLEPKECKTVASDLDTSNAGIYLYAHAPDMTWGRTIRYETRPDGSTRALTHLNPYGGINLIGLCVRKAMFDRDMRAAWRDGMECQRGFYPAGFAQLSHSSTKDHTYDLAGKKVSAE